MKYLCNYFFRNHFIYQEYIFHWEWDRISTTKATTKNLLSYIGWAIEDPLQDL